MAIGRQYNTGTGVRIAGDPGAVDGKQHQNHHQRHDDDALHVHADTFVCRLVFLSLLHLTNLHTTDAVTTTIT